MLPESVDKIYSSFFINKKQAQTLAFMALSYDIEQYIHEHQAEYEVYLESEKEKEDVKRKGYSTQGEY